MKFVLGIFALWLAAGWLSAQPARSQHVEAELVANVASVKPGETFWLALRLKMDPHWHTYWENPGDAGIVTRILWQEKPEGLEIGEFHWPTPKVFTQSGIVNYVYEGEVFLMMQATASDDMKAGDILSLKGKASWLECDDQICVPGNATVSLVLPVSDATPQPSSWAAAIQQTEAEAWPKPLPNAWKAKAEQADGQIALTLIPQGEAVGWDLGKLTFFSSNSLVAAGAEQVVTSAGDGAVTISLTKDSYFSGESASLPGVVRAENGWLPGGAPLGMAVNPFFGEVSAAPVADLAEEADAPVGDRSILALLALAFIGGLILNLMPCVFPVIGLKVMGFVGQAGESHGKVIAHGLAYTAGVLVSFWAIGLLFEPLHQTLIETGKSEGGWGAWLTPTFVLFLLILVFVFSLSLSGVFEIGGSMIGLGSKWSSQAGLAGAFSSGLFAVAVGAPCAAPFLTPVLGALVKTPLPTRELLLTMIGLGLAAPYLIFSFNPGLTRKLPKPGQWMISFKEGMAFLLYATVAWLVWVIADQVQPNVLFVILLSLVLAGMGCWIYGRWAAPHRSPLSRRVGVVLGLLLVVGPGLYAWSLIKEHDQREQLIAEAKVSGQELDFLVWDKWSPERVSELLAEGRPVYIDFTARWCATCQINKRVYNDTALIELFKEKNVATLKADWTNHDPAIGQALAEFDRSAVPFNVLYIPGVEDAITLPELLTVSNVTAALQKIGE